MEKILNASDLINRNQYTYLNWEYFLSISYFCMNIKYIYQAVLLSVILARKV